MKNIFTPAVLTACLFGVFPMASCVAPYDTYGSVTTYSPGYRLSTLPRGYRTEVIGGVTYYYNSGAYYRPRSGGYVIVDAPRSSRYYDDYRRHRHDWDGRRDRGRHDRDGRRDWDGRDGRDSRGDWVGRRDGRRSGYHRR